MLRVIGEARRAVTRDVVRSGASSATIRVWVHESSSVLVTSPTPAARDPSIVPYPVYAAPGQDFDYLCGQRAAIRESMGVMAHAASQRAVVSSSEVQPRVRAIEEVAGTV